MSIKLPVVVPDREPLTEAEALEIGDAVYRLRKLRKMEEGCSQFRLNCTEVLPYQCGSNNVSYSLTALEASAILALLIEREELFLASFNVETEKK